MDSPAWDGDWPVSQWFGINPDRYAQFRLAGHNGLDIAMPPGVPIHAPMDGTLVERGVDPNGYGLYAKLTTDDGQDWLFAHLSEQLDWPEGFHCPAGFVMGLSGSTGNSTGPHLHIGWRLFNAPFYRGWPFNGYVDPRQTLDRLQGGLWPPT